MGIIFEVIFCNLNLFSRVRQQLRRGGGGIDLFLQRVTLEETGHYTCRSKATNVTFNFVVISELEIMK